MNELINPMSDENLERLGADMLKLPQAPCNVRHLFSPGLYIRELSMGQGTIALGHAHKTAHLCIVLKGALNVLAPSGEVVTLRAPLTFIGQPGRKLAYVLEDCVFINVFANPTDERDIGKLEELLLIKSEAFEAHQKQLTHQGPDPDWQLMLDELNTTAEIVRASSERTEDLVDFPIGAYNVRVAPSPIEGMGLFATADIKEGEVVCPALLDGKRTPAGRYTNHAHPGNVMSVWLQDRVSAYWVASRDIQGSRGGQLGEEITIDYRGTAAWRLFHGGKT